MKGSPGRPRSVEINQAILQATLDLLAELGYQGLSIEAIATRAGVGKTTIYRRYDSKDELIAEALNSNRPAPVVPDTGSFWTDLDDILRQAANSHFSPLGRQTLAMILSLASSNPQFADIYWKKQLLPRRKAATVIFERAKARGELADDVDLDLVFDLMTGLLFKLAIFKPKTEPIDDYMHRAFEFLLKDITRSAQPSLTNAEQRQ